jgi:hypothetical protein
LSLAAYYRFVPKVGTKTFGVQPGQLNSYSLVVESMAFEVEVHNPPASRREAVDSGVIKVIDSTPPPDQFQDNEWSLLQRGATISVAAPFGPGGTASVSATINGVSERPVVLASSSRSIAVQFPDRFGVVALTVGGSFYTMRVIQRRVTKNDDGLLDMKILGLEGLAVPLQLTIWNATFKEYLLEGGTVQNIVINPVDVASGEFEFRRRVIPLSSASLSILLDGLEPVIRFSLALSPQEAKEAAAENLARQFLKVNDNTTKVLASFVNSSMFTFESGVQELISEGFANATAVLNLIRANGFSAADDTKLEANLVADYCYDIVDNQRNGRAQAGLFRSPLIFGFQSSTTANTAIKKTDVNRLPVLAFLKNFLEGRDYVVVGYMEANSKPEHATVYIDSSVPKGFTNRTFVLSTGTHQGHIALPSGKECGFSVEIQEGVTSSSGCF